ncbi:hypothetical protein BGZ57DRAFT_876303 [Hyaloscypha finlandica]|nr:hypothetical protein BGZ57DRAFT_876303 [Hyaloscypha finlandica]
MGFRDLLRTHSDSKDSNTQPTQTYGKLPPNAPQPTILNLAQPTPTVSVLTQTTDSKPAFRIDYSSELAITDVQTNELIGTVTFSDSHKLTLSYPATNTVLSYKDTLEPPAWFTNLNGNNLYWAIHAYNEWQATLYCEIVDGVMHEDDEDDVAIAVILDSKLKKGRIEFRKIMTKEETGLLLLSSLAEIEDLRGKFMAGLGRSGASGGGGSSDEDIAGDLKGILDVANSVLNLANTVIGESS